MGDLLRFLVVFVIVTLFVHRITYVIINDEGPGAIIVRFKKLLGHEDGIELVRPPFFQTLRNLFECPYCLSFYIIPIATYLAVSGGWLELANLSQLILYWGAVWGAFFFLEYKVVENQ